MGWHSYHKSDYQLNLNESIVCEFYQSKDTEVEHIPEIINPSYILTKKMKDNTYYCNLHDHMIFYFHDFLWYLHNVPSHIIFADEFLSFYTIRSEWDVPAESEEHLEFIQTI